MLIEKKSRSRSETSGLPVIISICFVAIAAIGVFGTLAWVTGELTLAQMNPLFIPIAPLTILLLVSLGASWFLYGVRPEYSWFRILAWAVGVLVVILTSLAIYHAVMPVSFSLEALMFPNPATLQGYPMARISTVTAVMFLLGGFSLILIVSSSRMRTRTGVAFFGVVILSCGVVTSIGYLYQAPLLYGSPVIPVSLPAAIAFLFLGTEVWAAAGRDCWPTRCLVGDSVRAKLLRAFLPVVALTLVVLLAIDQVLPSRYVTPLLGSLELLGGLLVVTVIVARLGSGIGGDIDKGIAERKRLQGELEKHSLHLEELVAERTGKLLESEEKYRELFEASPVSLWEEDFSEVKQYLDEIRQEGVPDLGVYLVNNPQEITKCAGLVKIINMNKATLKLYDAKSVDEVIGGLSGVLTEESNRAFVGEVVALAQGEKYYEAEFENRTLRGELKHCDVICAVVPGYEQSLARVLICIVDLTPQKTMEADLVKSQRLAAIGETAAKVGHDLRNPLQSIAGALYLLRKESLTTEERNEMLQVIENALNYSEAIIRDLSDYSAEIKLKLTPTTPKLITRDAIQAVKVPLNVRVAGLSDDQPSLEVDPDRMRRVFINLIQNAIDAMPQGGTLTISSKKSNDEAEITISDTGSGMPEKVMENLWKPFQTTKSKGMGLGLAICKRIVDAHGGIISVESKAGEGTTFTLRLPIKLETVTVQGK